MIGRCFMAGVRQWTTKLLLPILLSLVACSQGDPGGQGQRSNPIDDKLTTSAQGTTSTAWLQVLAEARGERVYWNAWAGDERINRYIQWTRKQVDERFGIELVHVKLQDTAEAVARILAEKSAGRTHRNGSVDLLWINGENFASLKTHQMLFGPFVDQLPAARFIDFAANPTFSTDFSIPVDGMEAPWGQSFLVFMHDSAHALPPPRNFPALLHWARQNPGRFTYPAPPDFIGSSFLKQALLTLAPADTEFARAPNSERFNRAAASLFSYLDQLHPYLWRRGRAFPRSGPAQRQLLADGEVGIAVSFNPADALSAVASGQLPSSVHSYSFDSGTLTNAHFLAIPLNARAKEAAQVVINFLLSPEAQAHKASINVWGDASVLSPQHFEPSTLTETLVEISISGPTFAEPHPEWLEKLEDAWAQRYVQ